MIKVITHAIMLFSAGYGAGYIMDNLNLLSGIIVFMVCIVDVWISGD